MTRSAPTALGYLALIVALSLSAGCVQTVPLTTTSREAANLVGRWTGFWRIPAVYGKFTLQLARGSGDRLTATAVWYGLPTVRRECAGTLVGGQLILGDPKTEGLTLTAQTRGVGGFSPGKLVGKGPSLVGPYTVVIDGRTLEGTADVSKDD